MSRGDEFRRALSFAWLDDLRQDIKHSFRQLRRSPAFAATAILTLSLGVGATTAIFTLIHAVLLKSLPVTDPNGLYAVGDAKSPGVYSGMAGNWELFSYDLYKDLRDHTDGFQSLAAFQSSPRRIGARRAGDPRPADPLVAEFVSGNYFSTLGVRAFVGRAVAESDDQPNAPAVAVISYRAWRERYGLDPSLIGATFDLNGAPVQVVGAAPPGFFGESLRGDPPDVWLPLSAEPAVNRGVWLTNPRLHWLYLMGRIQPGSNVLAIEEQMRLELRRWLPQWTAVLGPDSANRIPRQTLYLRPAAAGMGVTRTAYSGALVLLMTIAAFVLLIVCANIASLTLVRSFVRSKEISVGLALGASRWRVVRRALTDSVVISLLGGIAGVAIAFAGTKALLNAVFWSSSVPISAAPEPAVLAFALTIAILTGLVFGAAPAWSAARANPIDALRGSGRATGITGSLAQRALVVVQAALSVVLLAAAGLLTQSLRNLERQSLGFASGERLAVRIDPNLAGYKPEQLESLYRTVRERISVLPGVASVSYVLWAPMSGSSWSMDVQIDHEPRQTVDGQNSTAWNRVGPNYFDTVGTPILRGRSILESDNAASHHVAVINEAFARRFFPGKDPVGNYIVGDGGNLDDSFEIVGIAADAKYRLPADPVRPMFFIPRPQRTRFSDAGSNAFESRSLYVQDIVLRFNSGAATSESSIRRVFADIDPNLPIIRIQTFDVAISGQFSQETLIVRLTSLFGLTALFLAAIGLYGVTSYSVARRSREIGVRVALGARRTSIVRMVLLSAGRLVAAGLVFGTPLAVALGRVLGSRLYGVSWHSPAIFLGAALVLALSALLAATLPAARAASVDPLIALRQE